MNCGVSNSTGMSANLTRPAPAAPDPRFTHHPAAPAPRLTSFFIDDILLAKPRSPARRSSTSLAPASYVPTFSIASAPVGGPAFLAPRSWSLLDCAGYPRFPLSGLPLPAIPLSGITAPLRPEPQPHPLLLAAQGEATCHFMCKLHKTVHSPLSL